MSVRLDTQLDDFFKWYNYHKDTIPKENIARQIEFQQKMIANLFLVLKLVAEDLEAIEGPRRQLWLPTGMRMNGDVRN